MSVARPRLALCMNSSFFGFYAHAGFLQGLVERGIRPAAVSGASAGALVAAVYASGGDLQQAFSGPGQNLVRNSFLEAGAGWRALRALYGAHETGLIAGHRALDALHRILGRGRIEDCKIPLAIAVANLSECRSECVRSGPLAEFTLASCAVPGLFRARRVQGMDFWDGGIADPAPLDAWIDEPDIDLIVVHLVVNSDDLRVRRGPLRLWNGLARALQTQSDEIFRLKLELAERAGKRVLVTRTLAPRPGPFNAPAGDLARRAGQQTAANLQLPFPV
ncbi:MAG: patatin-like phospholipase family protein [Leptospirales bacterium]|nr:patatin-like phospholipase family protein [Leptospirales bacterium]